jgi:pimeloyl-ACP methyl ester carboxylesterase
MSFLVVAAAIYVALCGYMYAAQRSMMYFPTPETDHPRAQVMRLESEGMSLKIWTVRRSGPEALVYFGGNAEDVGDNLDAFSAAFPRHSLYLVNYRGYGGSSGRPTESALFADALALYDRIAEQHSGSAISVVGRSLGSGVAVYLASQRPVDRLALVTPYDSLANVASAHFPLLPVRLLLRDRYDSAGRASAVEAPVLVVIAENDDVIPRARSNALVDAFPARRVRVEEIRGAGHNTLDTSSRYLGSIRAFLTEQQK